MIRIDWLEGITSIAKGFLLFKGHQVKLKKILLAITRICICWQIWQSRIIQFYSRWMTLIVNSQSIPCVKNMMVAVIVRKGEKNMKNWIRFIWRLLKIKLCVAGINRQIVIKFGRLPVVLGLNYFLIFYETSLFEKQNRVSLWLTKYLWS